MDSLFLLAVLLVPAGLIALLILIGKVVLRMVNGPKPVDPDPPPELRRSLRPSVINAILVTLVVLGAISFAALYQLGKLGTP